MKAPWAKRGNGCSNFERKSGLEKWIGIAGACASNCKVSGVGEHSTSIDTCSASYHSYGSHITRMAANGSSALSLDAGCAAALTTVVLATAVCEVPDSRASANGLIDGCALA